MHFLSRRRFLAGASLSLGGVALAGCATTQPVIGLGDAEPFAKPGPAADYAVMYGPVTDEPFPIPAVDLKLLDPVYYRQEVDDPTGEAPGTIVVNTGERFLYHVGDGGRATRYGVGIGRAGFAWSGRAHIAYKRRWPTWTPPADMIARQPDLEKYRHGMAPGLDNALGARALYIHEGNVDTLYRLHGNPNVRSIGRAVSSGCVRLLNQDVIHLYDTVRDGSPILVV